jgi:hypothetical protein
MRHFYFLMRGIVAATLLTVLMAGTARAQEPVPEDFFFYYSVSSMGSEHSYDSNENMRRLPLPCFDDYFFYARLTPVQKGEIYDAIMKNDLWSVTRDLTQPPDGSPEGALGMPLATVQGQFAFVADGRRLFITFNEKTRDDKWSDVHAVVRGVFQQVDGAYEFPDDEC